MEQLISFITEKASNASPLGHTLKFVLEEGCIYVDGTGEGNTVSAEDKTAECTVKIAKDHFQAMLDGKLNPMAAFMTGKLKVEGDMGVAMKVGGLFS